MHRFSSFKKIYNTHLIALLAFLFTQMLFAQEEHAQLWETQTFSKNKQYEGYVVDLDGDTLQGYIQFSDRVTLQEQVYFFLEKGNKKTDTLYNPADLLWYHFLDKTYQCINHSGSLSSNLIKGNLLIEKGCISKHVWFDKAENYASLKKNPNEAETEFLDRLFPSYEVFYNNNNRETTLLDYFQLDYENRMAHFIRDNTDIATKVKNRDRGYGRDDVLEIIKEYNESCN